MLVFLVFGFSGGEDVFLPCGTVFMTPNLCCSGSQTAGSVLVSACGLSVDFYFLGSHQSALDVYSL